MMDSSDNEHSEAIMKLSQAIEKMLVSGAYNIADQYMCIVLRHNDLLRFEDDVQDMVNAIYPASNRGTPLVCALHEAGVINMDNMSWHAQFEFTQQLYCWWVFDLKRKGL